MEIVSNSDMTILLLVVNYKNSALPILHNVLKIQQRLIWCTNLYCYTIDASIIDIGRLSPIIGRIADNQYESIIMTVSADCHLQNW